MLPEVGEWVLVKHKYLQRYIEISKSVRKKWQPPAGAGATYIDLFCGCGIYRIRNKEMTVEGSPLVAWKASRNYAPFTKMFIADANAECRKKTAVLLREEGAPVIEVEGDALQAIEKIVPMLDPYGLHFAFLDPYSLGSLDFRIIERLAILRRIDLLVHISKMDMQRNLPQNIRHEHDAFDRFAPGWRENINTSIGSQQAIRAAVVKYWRTKITELGVWPSSKMKLIRASGGQPLYWLVLASKHDLARDFWGKAIDTDQRSFDF